MRGETWVRQLNRKLSGGCDGHELAISGVADKHWYIKNYVKKNPALRRRRLLHLVDGLIGTSVCALIAVFLSALLHSSSLKFAAPLCFIAVIVCVARVFGRMSGVLGSIVSAIAFALFLYAPVGSVRIDNSRARDNVNWMMLGGISLSMLFSGEPGSEPGRREL